MSRELEPGRWYRYEGMPESQRGRPVQIQRVEDGAVLGKFASGMERLVVTEQIGQRVADAVPGKTEGCVVCGGTEMVPVIAPDPDQPWVGTRTGTKPCPNCRGLD